MNLPEEDDSGQPARRKREGWRKKRLSEQLDCNLILFIVWGFSMHVSSQQLQVVCFALSKVLDSDMGETYEL